MQSPLYDGKYVQNGGPSNLLQRPSSIFERSKVGADRPGSGPREPTSFLIIDQTRVAPSRKEMMLIFLKLDVGVKLKEKVEAVKVENE